MIGLQIFAIVFALSMLYVATVHRRRQHLSNQEYMLWGSLWCGFMLMIVWPDVFRTVAQSLHVSRLFDLIVILSLMFLTLLSFYNRVAHLQLDEKINRLVRDRAIESAKKR